MAVLRNVIRTNWNSLKVTLSRFLSVRHHCSAWSSFELSWLRYKGLRSTKRTEGTIQQPISYYKSLASRSLITDVNFWIQNSSINILNKYVCNSKFDCQQSFYKIFLGSYRFTDAHILCTERYLLLTSW